MELVQLTIKKLRGCLKNRHYEGGATEIICMKKVLCFGELLLRLPPAHGGVWLKDNQMPIFIGGAELNVATALSVWGLPR